VIRVALQKNLNQKLSSTATTAVRYIFGLPFILAYFIYLKSLGYQISFINNHFLFLCFVAGFFQIVATILLVKIFSYRNFAIGITYSNTEALQTIILGFFLFAETVAFIGIIAIIIGTLGILIISLTENKLNFPNLFSSITSKSAIMGLSSGATFAICALSIREASLSLEGSNFMIISATTLITTLTMQIFMMLIYLAFRQKHELRKITKNLKLSLLVGLTSAIGSIGWFSAMTLQKAAYIKTVGQIQLIFALFISKKLYKEKQNPKELIGIALIALSILVLINKA